MLSDRVFQITLPLNDRELCPYEKVFTFGIWRRLFYSQIIAYFFSCKELCQDNRANIIGTFIYFNHQLF